MNKITVSKAIEGYLLAAQARRLSPHTIQDYTGTFRKFLAFLEEDAPVESITAKQVEAFLAAVKTYKKLTGCGDFVWG